jgi:small subunit ribosomal protein S16
MVRIRLKRMGRRHRPFFRICVVDAREKRDGRTIEDIGTYDPLIVQQDKKVTLKAGRAEYWLGVGAQPSESAANLLKQVGIKLPDKTRKTAKKKKKGKKQQTANSKQ